MGIFKTIILVALLILAVLILAVGLTLIVYTLIARPRDTDDDKSILFIGPGNEIMQVGSQYHNNDVLYEIIHIDSVLGKIHVLEYHYFVAKENWKKTFYKKMTLQEWEQFKYNLYGLNYSIRKINNNGK